MPARKAKASRIVRPGRRTEFSAADENASNACEVGSKAAAQFGVHAGDSLLLRNHGKESSCKVYSVVASGGADDTQIFTNLATAQSLADLPGRISLIQLSVTGTPDSINQFIADLARRIPGADVHGIKQFAEAEGRIYNRISGLLSSTILLVLLLTSLCVMAGMSNVAIERRNDVGLMKAIGGSVRRVVRLFLAEAIILGIAGGIVGSAIGLLVSIWLGKDGVRRRRGAALDRVSFFRGSDNSRFHRQRLSASPVGEHSSRERFSR